MRTVGIALLAAMLGYVVGLFGTMAAIALFSSNRHDTSLEVGIAGSFPPIPP
jgi:hypothetical protein